MENKKCVERHSFGFICIKNILYACGGMNSEEEYLNSCEMYDISTNKWTSISNMCEKTANFLIVSFNDSLIFKFGGRNEK